jgi:hypothetical protein
MRVIFTDILGECRFGVLAAGETFRTKACGTLWMTLDLDHKAVDLSSGQTIDFHYDDKVERVVVKIEVLG